MSKNILLICGSGASSGFMAANMRKAVKKAGLDYKIKARSESELGDYLDEIDALMVGPHLKAEFDAIKDRVPENVTAILMHPDYYSILDGKGAIEHLRSELGD
ncbi:PTS sugar transporter subunit IIB [Lactiplantibacillus mudanjiangensis]|uniref:PTS lactose transporter subunit IIB [Lactobacillus heilongjiangensis] n=1 Tax=Lactiplantibacillus mudanjiangensis TaxID=1296538 RepID=A0A660E3W8_9LACO|nr:PTS sugar transporter subunit IIB [Lactiplantibacillus mudanjiangensis]VDG26325.1 PTS lactose transporter subunit IIB [Lactobacillus heilongjiangensis] [Lactiplantibacillus mudanjiangensis]VDG29401.1 PTS lactose transporter subunit IIB [Lactobacillus heilongjiangensis] [Lactiplantibacillus mudanjiangensis]VDG32510.1 PTS lactose transporter subunit IIB [Lactobacillus heilongjiangensis] [Lactiplantibacillus mudanjiangensis]